MDLLRQIRNRYHAVLALHDAVKSQPQAELAAATNGVIIKACQSEIY